VWDCNGSIGAKKKGDLHKSSMLPTIKHQVIAQKETSEPSPGRDNGCKLVLVIFDSSFGKDRLFSSKEKSRKSQFPKRI
jgi:hypothetical protein